MHIKIPSDKKLGHTMTLRQTSFTNQITFALCFNDMKIPVQRFMNSKKILLIINAIIAKCHLSRILKDEIFPTLRY